MRSYGGLQVILLQTSKAVVLNLYAQQQCRGHCLSSLAFSMAQAVLGYRRGCFLTFR